MPQKNTVAEVLASTTDSLKQVSDNHGLEAELILAHTLKVSRSKLLTKLGDTLTLSQNKKVSKLLSQRLKNAPLAYLLGSAWFYRREFKVSQAVLIPRPETEGLVELALNWAKNKAKRPLKTLEAGTGSGCIALTLAAENKDLELLALDISASALQIARKNKKILIPANKHITFIKKDLFNFKPQKKFDLIISNPPYIPTNSYLKLEKSVKDFEPRIALDGGMDGLRYYRKLFELVKTNLESGGFACFELDAENYLKVKELAEQNFAVSAEIKILPDLAGRNRYLTISFA